jgi:DNA-binding FadR family transcriptional regulator
MMTIDPPALRRTDLEPRSTRGQTRPERAADLLAGLALAGEPGERLGTKDELRAMCGVSVGTFNEALRMVQARGVVTVRSGPGGGLFASQPSAMVRMGNSMLALGDEAASVADAFRLRHALDPLVVEDALHHASAHQIASLRTELDQMKGAADRGDGAAFVKANWALHACLAEISPSAMLRSFYLNLLEITESHVLAAVDEGDEINEYAHTRYRLHAALIDAIADHDDVALEILQEHNSEGPVVAT